MDPQGGLLGSSEKTQSLMGSGLQPPAPYLFLVSNAH